MHIERYHEMEPTKSEIDAYFRSPETRRLDLELKQSRLKRSRLADLSLPHIVIGIGALILLMMALLVAIDFDGVYSILFLCFGISFVLALLVLVPIFRLPGRRKPFLRKCSFAARVLAAIGVASLALTYIASWQLGHP
jgi:Zn-dependent protease